MFLPNSPSHVQNFWIEKQYGNEAQLTPRLHDMGDTDAHES